MHVAMSNLRRDWGELMAGHDDVVLDVFLMSVRPRKAVQAAEVPKELLAPFLMLAAEEPRVVDDFGELVEKMEGSFPPPFWIFTWHASVCCLKYRRGEQLSLGLSQENAERIRKAAEAWR